MLVVDPLERFKDSRFRVGYALRRDDYVVTVGCDLQRSVHPNFQQVEQCLIKYQRSAVSMLDELLCHDINVYTACIPRQDKAISASQIRQRKQPQPHWELIFMKFGGVT